jgi:hypothetical protein
MALAVETEASASPVAVLTGPWRGGFGGGVMAAASASQLPWWAAGVRWRPF